MYLSTSEYPPASRGLHAHIWTVGLKTKVELLPDVLIVSDGYANFCSLGIPSTSRDNGIHWVAGSLGILYGSSGRYLVCDGDHQGTSRRHRNQGTLEGRY
jgi:hypothetical protein